MAYVRPLCERLFPLHDRLHTIRPALPCNPVTPIERGQQAPSCLLYTDLRLPGSGPEQRSLTYTNSENVGFR